MPTQIRKEQIVTPNGWNKVPYTLVYVGTYQMRVTGVDVTAFFKPGTKLMFTQTTTKYGYVRKSEYTGGNTEIYFTGGADYTVANATIVDPYFSYQLNPQGFPKEFSLTTSSWSTSGTAFTNNPQNSNWFFWMIGQIVFYRGSVQMAATSGGTGVFTVTFTTGQLPKVNDSSGTCKNLSTGVLGQSGTTYAQNEKISFAKYDGTAIATNSEWCLIQGTFQNNESGAYS